VLPKLCGRVLQRQPAVISTVKWAVGAAASPLYDLLRAGITGMFWDWPFAFLWVLTCPQAAF
tara:strand:- start:122 stop:307 length:186 start_codon:yes stop_codon:yes gene_type:complete